MVTARHNTEARRVHYYEGGLYGPFLYYRWSITPSGQQLPIIAIPYLEEGDTFVVQSVMLTDTPIAMYEIPNLPNGEHDLWVQASSDGALWVPLYRDILRVVAVEVYEPL